MSKAFHMINHQILLAKLNHYGIIGITLNLFKSYLSNRKQYVDPESSISDTINITSCVPQGSILGP